MGNKSAPAVNILALAVTLFGAFSYLKTAPCVCRMTTLWTIHHIQIPTFAIRIIVMIHKISILRTLYSISRSSIFTSSSILVVKPLSGLTVCVRVVMVHSASSITPMLKMPWYSRPTTLSATAVWSLTPDTPTLRSHSWQSVAQPPPAATARPMKPAAAKRPATPIWPGQQCTHCLTNRCRASPPIPAILWRFFDGKE